MESLSEGTTAGYQQIHDGIIHLVDSAKRYVALTR